MAWTRARNGKHTGYYRDAEGRERSAGTGPSKRAVLRAAEDQEAKLRSGSWVDPDAGKITFASYFEDYWIANRQLEINSRETYWSHYRASLKPKFGEMALDRIKPSVVQGWVTEMQAAGTTPSSIKAKVKALQTVLAAKTGVSAMRDGYIHINPVYGVDVPTVPRREVTIYTPEQVDRLVEALPAWWQVQVAFDVETGLRWGELLGLRVDDVDFLRAVVHVKRTIIETKTANTGNGTRYLVKEYPKGKHVRDVGITRELIAVLAEHVKARGLKGADHLFSSPAMHRTNFGYGPRVVEDRVERTDAWPGGVPVGRNHFQDIWVAAIKKADIPYRRPHDLRASHISWLLAGGADLASVMERVAHNDFATTKLYTAALPDKHDKALAALASVRGR